MFILLCLKLPMPFLHANELEFIEEQKSAATEKSFRDETLLCAVYQVAASAGPHLWTGPEQRQPAAGPHYAQHHDQPGSSHAAGAQRMPHLLRAGSAGSLLPLPAQRGL